MISLIIPFTVSFNFVTVNPPRNWPPAPPTMAKTPTNIDAVDELIWKRDSITLGRKVASPAAIIPSTIPTIVMSTNEMLRLMTNKLRGKSFILKMKILI